MDVVQPEFRLGFKALAELIPDNVGIPLENEHHSGESGDGLQATLMPNGDTGLMVWRKADNWTAFTDGARTWINGPNGLEVRLNSELFDWERHEGYAASLPSPIIARWTSPNCWPGRPYGPPIAIVIHTTAGYMAGMRSHFGRVSAQASAHYGVSLHGDLDQYVELHDRAWANGVIEKGSRWPEVYRAALGEKARFDGFAENPNNWTVSIETEDRGNADQPVTARQYEITLAASSVAMDTYPTIKWLLRHGDISPVNKANCPGPRWVRSGKFTRLAEELGLKTLQ